ADAIAVLLCEQSGNRYAAVEEGHDIECITDHLGFGTVCLDLYELETAYYQDRQQYGVPQQEDNDLVLWERDGVRDIWEERCILYFHNVQLEEFGHSFNHGSIRDFGTPRQS
ncbi:hypothetical protein MAR_025175, partial [Mya arenaria]